MKYDTTLKDLLWRGAPALLRQLVGSTAVRLDPSEYPASRNRRPDFVALLADGRLFHLELQSEPDPRMAWRMLEYYGLIAEAHQGQPPLQQVLALSDAAAAAMPDRLSHPCLHFHYAVISIESLDAGPLLASERIDDNLLALLCRSDDIRLRVRQILERLHRLHDNERRDAVVRLALLSGLRRSVPLVLEEAGAMGIQIDLEQDEFFRDLLARWEARGMEKGLAQGAAEAKAETVLRLLSKRFGELSEARRCQIRAAAPDQLDRWLDALLDARSLDEVFGSHLH